MDVISVYVAVHPRSSHPECLTFNSSFKGFPFVVDVEAAKSNINERISMVPWLNVMVEKCRPFNGLNDYCELMFSGSVAIALRV